jgi:hypothetical protein
VPSPHPGSSSQLNSVAATPGTATTWAVGGTRTRPAPLRRSPSKTASETFPCLRS